MVSTERDISERKQVEEALRREREFLDQLIGTARVIVLVLDTDGRIVRFNPYLEEVSGWRLDEMCGKIWFDTFLPQADHASIRERFEQALTGKQTLAAVNPIVTKDGRLRDIEWYDARLTDSNGEPVGLLCTGHDVTARNRADRSLREREARLRAVLNTTIDSIITIDQRGIIMSANSATERIFGYPELELVGHNVKMLMPPRYADEHDAYLARYLATKVPHIIGIGRELTARRKDGVEFPIELAVSETGDQDLFTGIIRDVSSRVALQRRVLEASEAEQRRIGQELHDGTGQELTGLALFADTLADLLKKVPQSRPDNPATWLVDAPEMLRIRHIADRLSQGLLAANQHVKQLSHGIMPVLIEPAGLGAALKVLTAETDALEHIGCRFRYPEPVMVANATTATHLYRIAQEAVHNAVSHSKADQIRLSLRYVRANIVFTVRDNGVGFDLHAVRATGSPGVSRGFGLEIMQYRAAMSGGTLRVIRVAQGGTSVECTVPYASGT